MAIENTVSWERSGSVVECLTRDRGAAGSSVTGVTALWSLSKTHVYPSLVLVQPRKTRPCLTERLLMGRKESNQTNKTVSSDSWSAFVDSIAAYISGVIIGPKFGPSKTRTSPVFYRGLLDYCNFESCEALAILFPRLTTVLICLFVIRLQPNHFFLSTKPIWKSFFSSITKTVSLLNVVTYETDRQECSDPSCPDEVQRNWLSGVFRPQLSWWSPKKLIVRSVQTPAVLMKSKETDCQECSDPSCPDEVQRNWLSGVFRPQLSCWSPKKLVVRSVQTPAVLMKSKETGCQECSNPSCPDEVQRNWLSGVFRPPLSWWSPKKLVSYTFQIY